MAESGTPIPAMLRPTDGVVTVRPWQTDDADAAWLAIEESRAELRAWLPGAGGVANVDQVRQYIAATHQWRLTGAAYDFVIESRPAGEFLGGCGLSQINRNHRFCNLYYWVRTGRTRQGIARRAIRLVARFGLEQVGLQRVEIVVQVGNRASMQAAEQAGALREGVLRRRLVNQGAGVDAFMYSLVAEDFA